MSITFICGDARNIPLANETVQCVVTSPPYYGLRDYGVSGQIGLEQTPEEYVAKLVDVFREVRRVMREDGTLWLNLGDSYAGSGGAGGDYNKGGLKEGQPHYKSNFDTVKSKRDAKRWGGGNLPATGNLKPKDLIGIPWMVAFALRADGWYLRSDIIWHKPNPMPESVRDRPTKSHEYMFLLSKSQHYYYDNEAIREAYTKPLDRWGGDKLVANGTSIYDEGTGQQTYRDRNMRPNANGRNRRTVWTIATSPYSGAHFATFPPALV
jgi:DNA modification methylase